MLTFILFILILSILVLIHEFGHFYAAKRAGVRVDEFGFGLPPKLFGKKYGETEYTLNVLPFGGFVKLFGEDDMNEDSIESASHDPRNFLSKTPLQRISILAAGIFMNTILAMFLYYVFFMFTGFKTFAILNFFDYNFRLGSSQELNTVIIGYGEDSPALDAQLNVGEAILEVDGQAVYSVPDFKEKIQNKSGEEVNILVMDVTSLDRNVRSVKVVPRMTENGESVIGVYMGKSVVLDYSNSKLLAGPMHTYNILSYSTYTMGQLISASFKSRSVEPVSSSVSGPVGIMSVVGGIIDSTSNIQSSSERTFRVFLSLIDLTALLSISLAFINALPLPALDGGRLSLVFVEMIRKKRVSPRAEAIYHQIGIFFLLGLLILVTIKDIFRFF